MHIFNVCVCDWCLAYKAWVDPEHMKKAQILPEKL